MYTGDQDIHTVLCRHKNIHTYFTPLLLRLNIYIHIHMYTFSQTLSLSPSLVYTRELVLYVYCVIQNIFYIQNNPKKSLLFLIYYKKKVYSKFDITLIFKVIPIGIQNFLLMCPQLCKVLAVKIRCLGHKEVCESLEQVYLI